MFRIGMPDLKTLQEQGFIINVAKFQFQKYLDLLKIEKYRKSLCKLRVSSHRLAVETSRWAKPNKIPLDNRKCMICNVLEAEFHFVLECCLYKDLRKTYIKWYYGKGRICSN